MKLFVGTSRGLFVVKDGKSNCTLDSRAVREIVQVEDNLIVGTSEGLYFSRDGGQTWEGPTLEDYAVWQIRGDSKGVLYAGTNPAELFKSVDGGRNWKSIESFREIVDREGWCIPLDPPIPSQARAIVIDSQNDQQIWVGVEVGGILHTQNGGESWVVGCPGENPDLHMIFPHPEKPGTLFASTGYGRLDGIAEMAEGNAGVFRSDNSGASWEYVWQGISPRYSRPMCIDLSPPFAITVGSAPTAFSSYKDQGGAEAMLFRSEDDGVTWRSLCDPTHTPSPVNFHGLAANPEDPGSVFVGTDNGELWSVGSNCQWELLVDNLPAVLSIMPS